MSGIRDRGDAVKALCPGADAVAFGTSAIIAGGRIACMQCHIGQCEPPRVYRRIHDLRGESHGVHGDTSG